MDDAASEPIRLHSSDVRRLGEFYMNDFPPDAEIDSQGARLVAATNAGGGIIVMSLVLFLIAAAVFSVVVVFALKGDVEPRAAAVVGLICLLTAIAPPVLHSSRHKSLQRLSPYLDVNTSRKTASILAGRHRFLLEDVYGILAATIKDRDFYAELQLLVIEVGALRPYLILTSNSGSARASFGKQIESIGRATGLRVFYAKPAGMFGNGAIEIEESDIGRSGIA